MSPPPPQHNPKQEAQNRATYIPEHVKVAMDKQLQRNLPGHLKKYAGAYMQQQVMDPSVRGGFTPGGSQMTPEAARPPSYHPTTHIPHDINQEHQARGAGGRPVTGQPAEPEPLLPDHVSPEEAFDFIVNPEIERPKRSIIPTGSSLPVKIAFFGSALVVVMIVFVVAKSLIGGSSTSPSYVSIVQDQQELIHLTTVAERQRDLSVANKNFVATASLSLSSSQAAMINYLAQNGKKIKSDQINIRISKTTDAQLASAAAAATFNESFKQVMKTKLTAYTRQLQQAYQESTGEKGKAILSDEYTQANLLLTQLEDTRS